MIITEKKYSGLKDLQNRKDVNLLINRFYQKVRQDDFIGHFFNETIKDWDAHLEKLTDFWEANLFFKAGYKGNPPKAHQEVDQAFDHSISEKHFGQWLLLWVQTVDELFEGEKALAAKTRARKMATMLFMKIFEARKPG